MEKYLTNNSLQTKKIGEKLAKEILGLVVKKEAQVLALEGELGGGKTTFLQGFAKGLGIKTKILSPSFVIMRSFKIQDSDFERFYHIDCYRIKSEKEILQLGFKKIISSPKNIIAVEWSNYIKKFLPRSKISITFKVANENKRSIIVRWTRKSV